MGRTPRGLGLALPPLPAPWVSGAPKLRRLFVKRGRGSLALARPRSCLQWPRGVATLSPEPPRTDLLLWLQRQLILPPTRRIPRPEDARSRPRPPRSFLSAPFTTAAASAAAASRPVADRGEGNAKLTCAVQRERAGRRSLGLRFPEGAAGSGP